MPDLHLISAALLAAGGAAAFTRFRAPGPAEAGAAWPTARGEITHSEIVSETGRDADGRAVTRYRADIRYRYQLGRLFRDGATVRLIEPLPERSPRRAQKLLRRYPVGRAVSVHYDPRQPGRTVLEASRRFGFRAGPAVSAVLLLGGAGLMAAGL